MLIKISSQVPEMVLLILVANEVVNLGGRNCIGVGVLQNSSRRMSSSRQCVTEIQFIRALLAGRIISPSKERKRVSNASHKNPDHPVSVSVGQLERNYTAMQISRRKLKDQPPSSVKITKQTLTFLSHPTGHQVDRIIHLAEKTSFSLITTLTVSPSGISEEE